MSGFSMGSLEAAMRDDGFRTGVTPAMGYRLGEPCAEGLAAQDREGGARMADVAAFTLDRAEVSILPSVSEPQESELALAA